MYYTNISLDEVKEIPNKTIVQYSKEYISKQNRHFRSQHICKAYLKNELNISHAFYNYNKIYRSIVTRISHVLAKIPNIQFLGKGLYCKIS